MSGAPQRGPCGLGGVAPVLTERAGRVLPVVSRRKSLWVAVGLRCRAGECGQEVSSPSERPGQQETRVWRGVWGES